MKTAHRLFAATTFFFAAANLSLAGNAPVQRIPIQTTFTVNAPATPKVVTMRSALSVDELAKYQQKANASQDAANGKSAGAANTTTLVIIGVVVVIAVVALASSGGGGGSGY